MAAGEPVVLLIGSNAGRRVRALREAVRRLSRHVTVESVSRIFAGPPAGRPCQPWFLNQAVAGTTRLAPWDLLLFAKEVERRAGRAAGPRWGPRPLDVDILLMGDRIVAEPALVVPHPALARRRFCLAPAAEIVPDAPVPPEGRTIRQLLEECDDPLEVVAL